MLPRAEVLFSARPAQPKLLTGGLPCASSKLLSADGRGCPKGSPLAANTNGTQSCRPVLALWRCATAAAAGEGSSGARRGGAKLFVGVCTSEPECGPSREEPSLFEILHSDFRESNNLFELVTSFTQKARLSSWALRLAEREGQGDGGRRGMKAAEEDTQPGGLGHGRSIADSDEVRPRFSFLARHRAPNFTQGREPAIVATHRPLLRGGRQPLAPLPARPPRRAPVPRVVTP